MRCNKTLKILFQAFIVFIFHILLDPYNENGEKPSLYLTIIMTISLVPHSISKRRREHCPNFRK
jgi:hypothetical protein